MELTVSERLVLLDVLPKEGDFTTLKIIRKLRETLSFSEEEHKVLEFKFENNMAYWNNQKEINKNVVIGEKATDIIVERLKLLNELKKLSEHHYSLYEKFVETHDHS